MGINRKPNPDETRPITTTNTDRQMGIYESQNFRSVSNLTGLSDRPANGPRSSSASTTLRRKYEDQNLIGQSERRPSISANELFKSPPPLGKPPSFIQQLFSARLTVNNPLQTDISAPGRRTSIIDTGSACSLDLEDASARVNLFNSLQPERLIGNYKSLCNWYEMYISDLGKIKKKMRPYYEEQNCLIEKFQEIDNFLDAGKIHYSMLSNYGLLETHIENDMESEAERDGYGATGMAKGASDKTVSSFSRFHDVPGNVDYEGAIFLGHDEEEMNAQVTLAIMVNFFINFLLLLGKVVVSFLTSSMSMVASLVDSILDFLSTFIIYISNKLSTQKNWRVEHSYPVGRSRLEPLGVLVFSIIIIISFFQVGQESFKKLFLSPAAEHSTAKIGLDAASIMLVTIMAKVGCWLWCAKSRSSSVQALAQDAMTDIVFNTVSLVIPIVGSYLDLWWLDPLGALGLSLYVIITWSRTAFEHINNLTGAAADPVEYKVILYLAYRFAESIKLITNLKVYHVGDRLNVEIDIVFAAKEFNLSFKNCHDIAEALQYSIETLPFVERAFVHIDYMEGNFKGHLK